MNDAHRLALLDDPQLRLFLPLLYVAWADGRLGERERLAIAARLAREPWLRPVARKALLAWLDVSHPPRPSELRALRDVLVAAAGTLDPGTQRTLVELGSAMASTEVTPEGRRAAADLAALVGAPELDAAIGLRLDRGSIPPAPTFDVVALRRVLDGPHGAIRDLIRGFLASPERRAYGLDKAAHRALVRRWLHELERTGVLASAFPGVTSEAPDLRGFLVAFETLAFGDLSLLVKFGVQLGLFGGSLYFLGTEAHRALLPDVASLACLGCFAMSEVGHGSNVADLETVARYRHDRRELELHTPSESARKDWIGGAAEDARFATVFAQLEVAGERHGVHAILVPIRDAAGAPLEGVRIGDCGLKMGLNGVDNGRLWFDRVRVPVSALLDRFAAIDEAGVYRSTIEDPGRRFFTMLGTLVGGRISVGSAGVTIAKTALAIAVRYATVRRQFGPEAGDELPLIAYPTHQRRLLPPLATTYVLHFAFERLRARFVEAIAAPTPDTREVEVQAAGMKALATARATATVQACREACGGQGYLAVNRLPDLKADSDVFTTFEGDNTVLLQLVAKSLLSRFGKALAKEGVAGWIRMVEQLATTAIVEKNPIETRRTDPAHLRSREHLLGALAHREETLVRTAAMRMRKRLERKLAPSRALVEIQEHAIAAANAYVERLVYAEFLASVDALRDDDLRDRLLRLGELHALACVERDLAWYLEDGYVDAPKARAIRREVEAAMRELVPDARGLVDAFGIPDACLAAPIAFFDPARPLGDLEAQGLGGSA